uniref:Very-long-chain (3R)-3-hydroxyacyl-CoA dehydratase n=2 Tax=Tetraselmis sp. GSL018 TaxID=582737 RepID=A0A061S9R7_9CHLO
MVDYLRKAYLFSYNASLCCGWFYTLYVASKTYFSDGLSSVYPATELPLKVVQTAALMEVLHSFFGLVRSPVFVTGMQVASRIWILWGVVAAVPDVTRDSLLLTK